MIRAARIAGLLLLGAITAYALERWTLHPLRCSRAATRGAFALQNAPPDYRQLRVADRVRADLRDCNCNARDLHTRARASALLGDHHAAIADFQRALALDRRPETYFALGLSQLETLDRRGAIESLTRACAFDPARLNDIPHADVREEIVHNRSGAQQSSHQPGS